MCTVLFAFQVFEGEPLRVAANRDEQLDRPSETFKLRPTTPRTLAPRDLRAGGTWIGVNEHGVVSAITNRYATSHEPAERSRGELVALALEHRAPAAAVQAVDSLDPADFNGFHLTVGSPDELLTIWSDGAQFTTVERGSGIHVITERSFDAAESERERWLDEQVAGVSSAEELDELLLYEANDGFNGTLVSVPQMNYGTRSSTIVALGAQPRLLHAHGRPDAVPYIDLSDELAALLR